MIIGKKRQRDVFIILGFICLYIFAYINLHTENKRILNNLVVCNATVTKVATFDKYAHFRVDYCFNANDTNICVYTFHDEIPMSILKKMVGKKLLVAYDSTNPMRNQLLLTNSDYKLFNLVYPDSLLWIQKLVDPN